MKRFLKVLEVSVNLVCVVSNIVLLPDLNSVQRNRSTLTVSHLGSLLFDEELAFGT